MYLYLVKNLKEKAKKLMLQPPYLFRMSSLSPEPTKTWCSWCVLLITPFFDQCLLWFLLLAGQRMISANTPRPPGSAFAPRRSCPRPSPRRWRRLSPTRDLWARRSRRLVIGIYHSLQKDLRKEEIQYFPEHFKCASHFLLRMLNQLWRNCRKCRWRTWTRWRLISRKSRSCSDWTID